MNKVKISPEFQQFFGQNSQVVEDVKKEESRSNNVPVPIGVSGVCLITGFMMGQTPKKTNEDGTTKEGSPFCQIELTIIEHPEHQGKILKKTWWLNPTAKQTVKDKFQRMFDDFERLGWPREKRLSLRQPDEIGSFFLEAQATYRFEVVYDAYAGLDDNKSIRLVQTAGQLPENDSVVPGNTAAPAPEKKLVVWNEQKWFLEEDFGTKLQLTNCENPSITKIAPKDDCQIL